MKHLLILLSLVILIGCKKQDPTYSFEQENIGVEGLTFEKDSLVAALPAKTFKPSEILLGNGETIEQFLKRTNPTALNRWGLWKKKEIQD